MNKLVGYIQQYHKKGYSIDTLRSFLIKQGYNAEEVEEAISKAYTPEHHAPKLYWIVGGIAALVIIIALVFLIMAFMVEEVVLTMNVQPQAGIIEEGNDVSFTVHFSGATETVPVVIHYIVSQPGLVVDEQRTTRDAMLSPFTFSVLIPESGLYAVRVTATYADNELFDDFEVDVRSLCGNNKCDLGEEQTCSEDCPVTCGDGVCETGEVCEADCLTIVCGDGVCEQGESCAADCTTATCGDGVCDGGETCVADCEESVCGDGTCDVGESCAADCRSNEGLNRLSRYELTQYVPEQVAEKGAGSVAKECRDIVDVALKDVCYFEVSKAAQEEVYCQFIEVFPKKDDCYITYAFKTNDYKVCELIEDRYKRQTCDGLAQSYLMQQQYV
tara:strand:- start:51 stop:1211 length:1161 start_codon:yes stop_codon:yes gene_type:complete